MKKVIKFLFCTLTLSFCNLTIASDEPCCTECETCLFCSQMVFSQGLKFCESTLPYGDDLLIANFGGEVLNPLNTDGLGHILLLTYDGRLMPFIPADGNLSAPKGMLIKGDYLLICDVNKVVVYNTKDLEAKPQIVKFPEGELFVNDIVAVGDDIYVSVTNSGNIFKLNGADLSKIAKQTPQKWMNIVGANGLASDGEVIYVASYPADGVTTEDNVIYKVSEIKEPVAEKLIYDEGQWDGLALSKDGTTLYASSWDPSIVVSINLYSGVVTLIEFATTFDGAADISLVRDVLYIPELPNSRMIIKML